jgi:hypothetical protein
LIPKTLGISGPEIEPGKFLLYEANFLGQESWMLDWSDSQHSWVWQASPESTTNLTAPNETTVRRIEDEFLLGGPVAGPSCPNANTIVPANTCHPVNVGSSNTQSLNVEDEGNNVSVARFYSDAACRNLDTRIGVPACVIHNPNTYTLAAIFFSYGDS